MWKQEKPKGWHEGQEYVPKLDQLICIEILKLEDRVEQTLQKGHSVIQKENRKIQKIWNRVTTINGTGWNVVQWEGPTLAKINPIEIPTL